MTTQLKESETQTTTITITVDLSQQHMEKTTPNEAPTTMTRQTHQEKVSYEMIVARVIGTVDQETAKESEEDTPLYRRNLQKVMAIVFNAAAMNKSRNNYFRIESRNNNR